MGDEEEQGEPKYELYVPGSTKPRDEGSRSYTGQGQAKYLNGDEYNGTFVEGCRRGKGKYVFSKFGDTYEGFYELNKKHGFGKMTYLNQRSAEEEEAGEGDERPARGGTYLGYFSGGLRGSQEKDDPSEAKPAGTFSYINGDVYCGEWRAGKKHGQGTYSYKRDGTKMDGQWENGKIVSGKWIFPNGTFYVGKFRYNKPFGKGSWVFKNGSQLTGEYLQKEKPSEEDAGGDDEEGNVVKPDPKVWTLFQTGRDVKVSGGTMMGPRPKQGPLGPYMDPPFP